MPEKPPLPAPWALIEHKESIELVDAKGQGLLYIYFDDSQGFPLKPRLTKALAMRLAKSLLRHPDLVRAEQARAADTKKAPPA